MLQVAEAKEEAKPKEAKCKFCGPRAHSAHALRATTMVKTISA